MKHQVIRLAMAIVTMVLTFVPRVDAQQQSGRIAGTVTNQDGQAVSGAYVVVLGTRHGALTDGQGNFAIANVAPGTYSVKITHISFKDGVVTEVAVQSGGEARIAPSLVSQPVALSEVVVSASRQAQKITDAPATVTKLSAEVLANSVGNSFSGALKDVKGIDYVQVGVTSAGINARGFNSSFNNRMLMVEDGRIAVLPENGLPVGGFTTLNKLDLASVEVLIGPGAALYGADASNGVITLTSKDPRQYPGQSFEIAGGSNSYIDVQGRMAGVSGKFGYKLSGEYQTADDWSNSIMYGRTATFAGRKETGVGGKVNWTSQVARGNGALFYYMGESQIEASAGYSLSDGVGQTNVGRNQLDNWVYNVAQLKFSSPRWFANVYRTQSKAGDSYALNRFTDNKAANPSKTDEELRLMSDWPSDGQLYAAEIQNNFQVPVLDSRIVWGGQYRRDIVSSDRQWLTDRLTGEDLSIDQKGVYAQLESNLLKQLTLVAAARYDDHENYDAQFSPKVGLVFKPMEGHALRVTYNRAFKSPTILQTNFHIPDFTPVVGVYGNTAGYVVKNAAGVQTAKYDAVRPEENTTWELGYKAVLGDKLFFDAAAYQADYVDFLSPLSVIANPFAGTFAYHADGTTRVDPVNRLTLIYFNLGAATLRGTDLGVKWLATRKLDVSATFSYTDLKDVEVRTGTPANIAELTALNAPPIKWTAGANVKEFLPRLSGGFTARHVTGYVFRSGINAGWIPTFNTLDFNFSYAVKSLGVSVNANVQNAFACVSEYTLGTGATAFEVQKSERKCGFDRRHQEMVNMPALGTMFFLGIRYNR